MFTVTAVLVLFVFAQDFTIATAHGCAWRAFYVRFDGRQVFHAGIDPGPHNPPQFFGGLWLSRVLSCSWRVTLPHVPWSWCVRTRYARPVCALYRASSKFWGSLDGRLRNRFARS